MKKIIRPEGPAKKNNLAPILSEKKIRPRHRSQAPPPEYQMDRALARPKSTTFLLPFNHTTLRETEQQTHKYDKERLHVEKR